MVFIPDWLMIIATLKQTCKMVYFAFAKIVKIIISLENFRGVILYY